VRGATVVLVTRNQQSGERTVREIITQTGNRNIDFVAADLAEPDLMRENFSER